MTYNFATTQHDHTTEIRKVHIARENEDTWKTLCGYRDGMLNGGEAQTPEQVKWSIEHDPDGYICARCAKAFAKLEKAPAVTPSPTKLSA